MGFTAFAGHKYLNLETLKKDGTGVKTPVWFAADSSSSLDSKDARLYVYTIEVSGKVKRIRNNPRVKIAPCDMRGKVLGDWVEAHAQIVTGRGVPEGRKRRGISRVIGFKESDGSLPVEVKVGFAFSRVKDAEEIVGHCARIIPQACRHFALQESYRIGHVVVPSTDPIRLVRIGGRHERGLDKSNPLGQRP